MRLSMSLIARHLNHYQLKAYIQDDKIQIRGVRFLSDPRLSLSAEYVYFGRADSYFSDGQYEDTFLIVNGRSRILCYNCDYEELLNDLMGAFEYFNDWERKLWRLGAEHASMQKVLDASADLLNVPVLLSDLDGNLLACQLLEAMPEALDLGNLLQTKKLPASFFNRRFLNSQNQSIRDIQNAPMRFYAEDLDNSAVCSYLVQDGERVAFFQIMEHPVGTSGYHIQLMELLLPIFLLTEELSGSGSGIRSNASVIARLLSGDTVSAQALEKFGQASGLMPPWQLLVMQNLTTQNYTQRSLLIKELNSAKLSCFALEYEDAVLVITQEKSLGALLRNLKMRLGIRSVAIGISMPVPQLTDLPIALRQARFALEYQSGPGHYACRDYALQYLLKNLQAQDMVAELLHPAISVLSEYDRKNGTQLLQTLRVYMENDCSQLDTAQALHTHRNTIKYRLERISQLTEIDYRSWEERNYLNLSLMLTASKAAP